MSYCVYSLSGTYCLLNRLLFFVELSFGLLTLALGYEWLALIAIALNYSGAAAFHALVLTFTPAAATNDLDSYALVYILTSTIFFAYPLLQWSRTLRYKKHVDSRLVIAVWTFLVCLAEIIITRAQLPPLRPRPYVPIEVNHQCVFSRFVKLDIWHHDWINPLVPVLSVEGWHRCSITAHLPCKKGFLSLDTPFRRGGELAPVPILTVFEGSGDVYSNFGAAYEALEVATCVATIGAVFNGKWSTHYVRARIYERIRGQRRRLRRTLFAFMIALTYHAAQFVIGITSIPLAMLLLTYGEMMFWMAPPSELPNHVGQWGPWIWWRSTSGFGYLDQGSKPTNRARIVCMDYNHPTALPVARPVQKKVTTVHRFSD